MTLQLSILDLPCLSVTNSEDLLQVPLYSDALAQQYANSSANGEVEGLQPHVFLTASQAFQAMCNTGKPQSLVISGESGSGKTETTKIAMQVFSRISLQ